MALDNDEGVWKSGKGRGRKTPKGRQYQDQALQEVHALLKGRAISRDLLIEFLHLIQDAYGHLSAPHLRALAEIMRLSMAEVYEVATFYAHFDIIKEGETPPPALTIRVCDSLSCELAGAKQLKEALEDGLDPNEVRVLRAPCMGRCDTAPTLELGRRHIGQATIEKVKAAIKLGDTHVEIPSYETLAGYRASGGYTSGRKPIIDLLRQKSRPYLFSNSVAPPIVAASVRAIELLTETTELRDRLESNTRRFRAGMEAAGFDLIPGEHPIVPIMLGDAVLATRMADLMLQKGVYVIGFSFPVVPKGKARIRTQISAAHSEEDIDFAIEKFIEAKQDLKI